MTTLGPYESRSIYAPVNDDSDRLHFDPAGREWAEFLAEDNPRTGDGAARSPRAAAASPSQCAPSPQPTTRSTR